MLRKDVVALIVDVVQVLVGIGARPRKLLLLRECILHISESFRVANLTASVSSPSIGLFLSFLLACLCDELFNSRWLVVLLLFFELVLGQLEGK